MDYKEKYEHALNVCKWLLANNKISEIDATDMFRELIDDEKIRISLINKFKLSQDLISNFIAWLEKQDNKLHKEKVDEAMREIEEKARAFSDKHKGESSDEILEQMRGEQKSAWSEEDELKMDTLIHVITNQKGSAIFEGLLPEELVNWLKSLKERMKGE